jgi:hypothetical protein
LRKENRQEATLENSIFPKAESQQPFSGIEKNIPQSWLNAEAKRDSENFQIK